MSSTNISNIDEEGDEEPVAAVVEHHDPWAVIAGVAGNMLEVRTKCDEFDFDPAPMRCIVKYSY